MRHILVYLTKFFKVVDGVQVLAHRYSSNKPMKATAKVGEQAFSFNVSYFNPKQSDVTGSKSDGAITLWLNDEKTGKPLTSDRVQAFVDVYGSECILQFDADGHSTPMPLEDFQALPQDEQNIVSADVFAPSPLSL